jgi:chorismate dehydratase
MFLQQKRSYASRNRVCYTFLPRKTSTLPKLRISIVQYLNTAPLVRGFTHGPLQGKYDLSFTVPSLCAEALRKEEADVAIIPAIEYQRISDLVVLPDLSIASKNRVRSLLIVSKGPVEQARSIALDASSRSTQALTRILCARHWKIAPQFIEQAPDPAAMLQNADAALLIGDPALRLSLAISPAAQRGAAGEQICPSSSAGVANAQKLHVYDVVEEWRKLTGLPAVLAVWAARLESVTPELVADFQSSLDLGVRQLNEICSQAAADLALPAHELLAYLSENINFTLDSENLQGLMRFFNEAAALKLIDPPKDVAIAGEAGIQAISASN